MATRRINLNNSGRSQYKLLSFIFLIAFFCALFALSVYIYKNFQKRNVDIDPQRVYAPPLIHTKELPTATLGTSFSADTIITIHYMNEEIPVEVNGLPQGLKLGSCETTYNVSVIPVQPNSVTRCVISGTPTESGIFKVVIDAKNPYGRINTVQDIIFTVSDQEPSPSTTSSEN